MTGQNNEQHQKRRHHKLGDSLKALLQAEADHHKTGHHVDRHPESHPGGVGQHGAERAGDGSAVQAGECPGEELEEVAEHPARHRGVVHHEHVASDHAEDAVDVPPAALGLQRPVGLNGAAAARAAHGQLHGEHRGAHN